MKKSNQAFNAPSSRQCPRDVHEDDVDDDEERDVYTPTELGAR